MRCGLLRELRPFEKGKNMSNQLFFVNVPYNCSDREFQDWIESAGIRAESVRVIRDLVSGVSPAFAYASLQDHAQIEGAVSILNGRRLGNQTITVSRATLRRAVA
jgi:RNA recognition motif-containing protein